MLLRLRSLALVLGLLALGACTASKPPNYYYGDLSGGLVPGDEVTVARGENVYTIARNNGVRMRDIIVLNNLQAPFTLKAGQKLVLPAKGGDNRSEDRDTAPAPSAAPVPSIERRTIETTVTAVPLEEPAKPASDTLASKATVQPAQPQPQFSPKVPFGAPSQDIHPQDEAPVPLAADAAAPSAPASASASTTASASASPRQMMASRGGDGQATSPQPGGGFIWPVQGPILSGFGSKGQGMNNDGINIAAPKGAPVVAAAGGTVAYAGDEMKGFGNLILVRHEGNWVTAYAHLDRIIVTKDTVVAAGDMIGTVGTSGGVASPQLHFETREDGKPRDPARLIRE